MSDFVCFNGEILQEKEVRVSPLNRGMMYGDGCFETFRSYAGKFLGYDLHFTRLADAFEYLSMDLPFDRDYLKSRIRELISRNKLDVVDSMIRVQCWRKGGRGYKTESRECEWIITAGQISDRFSHPSKLVTTKIPVLPSKALSRDFKLSNGLNYIVASDEATKENADDVVMLTMEGFVSETTIANIFFGIGSHIFTPSVDCDLLPGVTRELAIQAIKESGFQIEEGKYLMEDLMAADFVFTTNSISEIRPVQSINNINFDTHHSLLKKLHSLFEEFKLRNLKE